LLAHPELAERYGIDPPSGLLLYGPPGTGKTTVAKVLAAQSACSFYSVSAAELTSKWLGESERLISQLFERARDNRPSIVFIDEIDAIAGLRGGYGTYDRQVNQLLQEIDGIDALPGVLVVGATNRKDMLDPALLRGGRLARHVEIALPDAAGRQRLLALFTKGMPLDGVNLDELAARTEGYSGADIESLAHEAGVQAMIRNGDAARPNVTAADFATALTTRVPVAAVPPAGGRRRAREGYV
jgi:transitional endoplasmic reticulum ATPase